jgi:hypothetical protein
MAFFMLYDNIRGSIKYGANTFAPVELKNLTILDGDVRKGSRYEAVSFYMLEQLFEAFRKVSALRSIVDLGAGKGRVLMTAAHFGFVELCGIYFAKELCDQASANMKIKERQFPGLKWRILQQNVIDYEIRPDDSVFFLFNPFSRSVLKAFLRNLDISCDQFPRTVYFLYASPQYQKLLLDNGYAIIFQKEKMFLKSIIAVRE